MALSFGDYSNGSLHVHRKLTAIDTPNPNNSKGWTRKWRVVNAIKKNSEDREVDVSPKVGKWFEDIRNSKDVESDNDDLLFEVETLKPFESRMKKACRLAGITALPPASLRKTYASYLYAACLDLGYVARQLGHTNTITAPSYYIFTTKIKDQNKDAAQRFMDEIFTK